MAAIKEYNAPNAAEGLNPSNAGLSAEESLASTAISTGSRIRQDYDQAGRAIGSGITAVGEAAGAAYKQFVEQPDINKIALAQAQTQSDINDAWDEAQKKGNLNDPTLGKKFIEGDLEDKLTDFVDGATTKAGKQYAFDEAVRMRNHMFEKTTADVATRAGQAVMVSMDEQKNILSNAVRKDPTSFDSALAAWNAGLKARIASSPGLDAGTASKLQTIVSEHGASELAHAAILGTAAYDPAAAKAMLDSGKFDKYVDGTQTAAMIKNMDYASRATQNFQRAEQDRAAQATSDKAVRDYELQVRQDPSKVSAIQAIQDPNLTRTDAVYIAKMIDREAKPEALAKVSNANEANLYQRVYLPEGDPMKITDVTPIRQAYIAGKLTQTARDNLIKQVTDQQTEDGQKIAPTKARFFTAAKTMITKSNPMMGVLDKEGDQKFYEFQNYVDDQINDARRQGKSVYPLLTPGNPAYLASPAVLQGFQKSMGDSMRDGAAALRRGTANDTPPALKDYPDAKKAVDGNYHVQRDGKWFTIKGD